MSTKVLIADDAGFIREILNDHCSKYGYLVIGEAANGEQAIDLAFQRKPQIIFMDLVMPNYNGVEACQKILEQLPTVYVVAVSSADEPFIMQQAFQAGCRDFLKKPFTREDIFAVFNRYRNSKAGEKHA